MLRDSHRDEKVMLNSRRSDVDAFYCNAIAASLEAKKKRILQQLLLIAITMTLKSLAPASIFRNYQ